jgi:hypothetical protein
MGGGLNKRFAEKEGKQFFYEKKNQKTFTSLGSRYQGRPKPNMQKFFVSFFQKRSSSCFALNF